MLTLLKSNNVSNKHHIDTSISPFKWTFSCALVCTIVSQIAWSRYSHPQSKQQISPSPQQTKGYFSPSPMEPSILLKWKHYILQYRSLREQQTRERRSEKNKNACLRPFRLRKPVCSFFVDPFSLRALGPPQGSYCGQTKSPWIPQFCLLIWNVTFCAMSAFTLIQEHAFFCDKNTAISLFICKQVSVT